MCIFCTGEDISGMSRLEISCPNITVLPEIPNNIEKISVKNCILLVSLGNHFPPNLSVVECITCPLLQISGNLLHTVIEVHLENCPSITELPSLPTTLISLTLISMDIESIVEFPSELTILGISKCPGITELPEFPHTLEELKIHECTSLNSIPTLLYTVVRVIDFFSLNIDVVPELSENTIIKLEILSCDNITFLPLNFPNSIHELSISDCIGIINLTSYLPTSLKKLNLDNCTNLKHIYSPFPVSLEIIYAYNCMNLTTIPILPASLKKLNLDNCTSLINFPENEGLTNLKVLSCMNCPWLIDLPVLPNLLRSLDCSDCIYLEFLPNPLPASLIQLNFLNCPKIKVLPNLPETLREMVGSPEYLKPDSLDRYNEYKNPLKHCLILSFPRTSNFTIYNSYMAENVNMKEFLNESKSNFCFITILNNGNFKGWGCSLEQLSIKENLIVECKGKYTGLILRNRVKWNKWYCKIGLDQYNPGIILSKLNSVEKKVKNGFRIFFLSKYRILPYTATVKNVGISIVGDYYVDIFGNTINYISGNHCTDGTSNGVYNDISIANINLLRNYLGHRDIPKRLCRA